MNHRAVATSCVALLLMTWAAQGPAWAQQSDSRLALTAKGSTLGLGVDVAYRLGDRLQLRGQLQGLNADDDFEESGIDYDAELELASFGAGVDFYPTGGGFLLSAGLVANSNAVDVRGLPQAGNLFEIGDDVYTAAEVGTLDGEIDFDSVSPFATLGWGNPFHGGRVGFRFEVGALYQGDSDVRLAASNAAATPGLQEDIDAEIAELENDLDDFEFWPIVSLGVTIRF